MKVAPIKTERDYDSALAKIDRLMDARPNTPRGDELDILVTVVEAYEAKHWAIDPPDPIEAIKIRMEQRGLTRRDLQKIVEGSGRVSEILNGKRSLSVAMMRRLHQKLDIPAESFLQPTRRAVAASRRSPASNTHAAAKTKERVRARSAGRARSR